VRACADRIQKGGFSTASRLPPPSLCIQISYDKEAFKYGKPLNYPDKLTSTDTARYAANTAAAQRLEEANSAMDKNPDAKPAVTVGTLPPPHTRAIALHNQHIEAVDIDAL
jgi:hypothetical protein